MREIKFRFWNPEKNTMKEWGEIWIHEPLDDYFQQGDTRGEHSIVPLQYTGVKDKNGREIYEGDIVQHQFPTDEHKMIYKDIVEWVAPMGGFNPFVTYDKIPRSADMQIIGNIYQTPEVLR